MKTILFFWLLLICFAVACRDSNSPEVTAIIDSEARRDNVITDTKGPDSIPFMDTTRLVVDAKFNTTLNGTQLRDGRNAIYQAVYYNWLHAYTLVRRVPAIMHIAYEGNTAAGGGSNAHDEVVRAQERMKTYIARDRYRKRLTELTPEQQTDMQQQYPILYQTEFR